MTLYKEKLKVESNRLRNWDYSSEALYFITMVTKNRECIFGSIDEGKMILNENGKIVENELLKSIKIRKNWFFHNWVVMPNHVHLLIEIQQNIDSKIESSNITTLHINPSHINPSYINPSNIVETHRSASSSSISATIDKTQNAQTMSINVAETHCGASLQNQSLSKIELLNIITPHINQSHINPSNIVETHRSASPSSISAITDKTKNGQTMSINVAETSLQNESLSKSQNNQSLPKFSRKSNSISSFVAIFKSVTTKQINGLESIWQQNYHDHIVRNYKTFETIYDYIKNNPISWETDSINTIM
ncbi:hypothetical protein ASE21_12055 [Flavobacterium sp. Root901]|uniref:transposase n=1 Tax=Flavobacterium sp. Root901 TaxID=1736605 RepID=UPI00070FF692|nr:transposase [Flavobacterium sp. Root901]KRD10429.1 hypothetical protein ASE21_12055 [Flavobacterium sp. Root901]